MNKTLVVSLGSTIMSDDSIGHYILNFLEEKKPKADIVQLDTDIFKIRLHFKNHSRIIIIDALQSIEPVGTIHVIPFSEFNKIDGKIRGSHFLNVKEGIELMKITDKKLEKAEIFLVGIVVKKIELGTMISSELEEKIEIAVDKILSLIR